mmetsp:Transcript_27349/g.66153  ORF Transcript_27349/g.66153 Transcript_27349/m.66153 type:complete len:223 (-) Transcript_27349:215-883(-)
MPRRVGRRGEIHVDLAARRALLAEGKERQAVGATRKRCGRRVYALVQAVAPHDEDAEWRGERVGEQQLRHVAEAIALPVRRHAGRLLQVGGERCAFPLRGRAAEDDGGAHFAPPLVAQRTRRHREPADARKLQRALGGAGDLRTRSDAARVFPPAGEDLWQRLRGAVGEEGAAVRGRAVLRLVREGAEAHLDRYAADGGAAECVELVEADAQSEGVEGQLGL